MTQTTPTVILFDIDGTLISTHGAGRRAFERALDQLVGPCEDFGLNFAGSTDRGSARKGLVAAGAQATEEAIDRVLDIYLSLLPDELDECTEYTVFDGVVDLLEMLVGKDRLAMGLGTGNIERGARLKLARGGLNDYFDFGGFGCDAERITDPERVGPALSEALGSDSVTVLDVQVDPFAAPPVLV